MTEQEAASTWQQQSISQSRWRNRQSNWQLGNSVSLKYISCSKATIVCLFQNCFWKFDQDSVWYKISLQPVETENKICEGWELGEEESLSRGGRSSIVFLTIHQRAEHVRESNTDLEVWGTMGPRQTKTQVAQRVETIPNSGEEPYLHISHAMLANVIKCLCWLRFIEIVNIFIAHFKRWTIQTWTNLIKTMTDPKSDLQ